MIKHIVAALFSCFIICCTSCQTDARLEQRQPERNPAAASFERKKVNSGVEENGRGKKISGIYEYVYEFNTPALTENHYIRLNGDLPSPSGTYYGTSDDFDEAREGYPPGFFRSEMREVNATDSTISFKLSVRDQDFYVKPITPLTEVKDSTPWQFGVRFYERHYTGDIKGDTIVLRTKDLDPRVFVRRK